MKKTTMTAAKSLSYGGHRYEKGDQFAVKPKDARLLRAIGKAAPHVDAPAQYGVRPVLTQTRAMQAAEKSPSLPAAEVLTAQVTEPLMPITNALEPLVLAPPAAEVLVTGSPLTQKPKRAYVRRDQGHT